MQNGYSAVIAHINLGIHDPQDRSRLLHMVMLLLPKYHRDTLEVLLIFLKWVASFSHVDEETGSKMDLNNLATVITPSILKANKRDGIRDESFPGIKAITQLLEEQDELYLVPIEFTPLLQEPTYFGSVLEQPGKDVLKKVDTFMRLRQGATGSGGKYSGNLHTNTGKYQQDHTANGSNGQTSQRPNVNLQMAGDYTGKALPTFPNSTQQPFSSPYSDIRTPELTASPRQSFDGFWAPTASTSGTGTQRGTSSRPTSFVRSSNEPSPVFGSFPVSRNSPLGAG